MQANGYIRIGRTGDTLEFRWEGGDVAAISLEFLADIDSRWISYSVFPDCAGRRLVLGPYVLEVIAIELGYILVQRV